ncbi:hypothetical protein BKA70DRAFT_1421967 [Coprinopsis sp. MPI-PUGE-AT-0042]|nr:hypothetical protein BKA70DRAFT_1451542 [Coprinopsis sp. MPI-PUGE-AT-0042]KAH6880905.1 hypothetical protein BKA70DRAFT_1447126 [Coprinopsis sp. MPI-PUGE-AT-0042]KAH6904831.1 hypothetical protein BKA70DRAFT_1431843 [Coprinopsis sp. MPI-PUGE-AT-0042]KAH6913706.1 hypothetical protein BKA70DRAFT_1421967 [Coprinopsis sp. MPI-PUGE-AT-0042]
MFNFNGRDAHCTLPVSKIHLPFHKSIGKTLPERVKTEDDDTLLMLIPPFDPFLHLVCVEHGPEPLQSPWIEGV